MALTTLQSATMHSVQNTGDVNLTTPQFAASVHGCHGLKHSICLASLCGFTMRFPVTVSVAFHIRG